MTAGMLEPTIPFDPSQFALTGRNFELGLSENPFPPLPSVLDALTSVMAQANKYPEFLPERLPRVIANRVGVAPDQVVVGSGATGVAMQIMQSVMTTGDRIVFALPNFDGYPIMAGIVGMRATAVPLDSAGRQDLRTMAAAIDRRTSLVVVCRPHNPTGTLVTAAELERFLAAVPRRVTVILDGHTSSSSMLRTRSTLVRSSRSTPICSCCVRSRRPSVSLGCESAMPSVRRS